MNNKVSLTYQAALSIADQTALNAQLAAFRGGIAQILMDMNDIITVTPVSIVDLWYLPNSVADMTALTFDSEIATRQDVKRYIKTQLSVPTLGQGLVIISATDVYERFFTSSEVIFLGSGLYVRFGICSFTQTLDNDPFTDAAMIASDFLTAYFDITKKY